MEKKAKSIYEEPEVEVISILGERSFLESTRSVSLVNYDEEEA